MAVVFVKKKVTPNNIKVAQEEYGKYIKIVIDVENKIATIGGEWHADGEKVLLENGASQDNIWGGGIDLDTKNIETIALINLRPKLNNNSQEILNENIRKNFIIIASELFKP